MINKKGTGGGGGAGYGEIQYPIIDGDAGAVWDLNFIGTEVAISAKDGYRLEDVTLNGESKGAATVLKGLKTGDNVYITTITDEGYIRRGLAEIKLVARSKMSKAKGKKAIKVYWFDEADKDFEFTGYEVFRSLKRSTYGKKPFFQTTRKAYWNTAIKKGTRYYYKVRGYVEINGERFYTKWSKQAWRKVK